MRDLFLLNMDKDLKHGQKNLLGKARQLLQRELMLATDESTLNQEPREILESSIGSFKFTIDHEYLCVHGFHR